MTESPKAPPRRIMDPAALPLLAGGAVLLVAGVWLWVTPRPAPPANPPAIAVAALEQRLAAVETLGADGLRAVEEAVGPERAGAWIAAVSEDTWRQAVAALDLVVADHPR